MNLMFWRKKTSAGAEAEIAPENIAQNTRQPEPSGAGETRLGTTAQQKLVPRIKSWFGALASRFKRTPAFRAEVEPGVSADPKQLDEAASGFPEAPANPQLSTRIKLRFIALARRFGNKPATGDAEDMEKKGLPDRSKTMPETGRSDEEPEAVPVHSRKRLVIGGAIGLLVFLLAGVVIAYWPIFGAPPQQKYAHQETASLPAHPVDAGSAPAEPLSEVESLRKKNAELQAHIEALEMKQQQQLSAPPARQPGGRGANALSASGEVIVDSNNPKSSAMSLKEAIETMNASSGDYKKPPPK